MAELPTGTVIFLFTDIEGSTSRWERNPAAMQEALIRHDAILRHTIESHGGVVFKTVGDSFYAVFQAAPEALTAALAAQHLLVAEPWSTINSLSVRMALHAGTAAQRDGDYFGPPLNRVARLLAAGHGGQILVSLVVQELLRNYLAPETELRDIGQHQLKDLIHAEHIFQVVHTGLRTEFPPLRTLTNRPTNLPAQLTLLLGREQELAVVQCLMHRPDVRLLTLTGPGGTGKTRLGLQVAAELSDRFAHGIFFVPLASVTDPNLVVDAIALSLGMKEGGEQALVQNLKDYLRDKQILLILDNFEQVLDAAPLVSDLLMFGPQIKILVTSRAALRLYGEHEFPVAPLALPDLRKQPPLPILSQYAAVALFIERAQAIKPDFTITTANAPAVAEICVRLDGLPLAIELAAARIKLFTPEAMLPRLTNRLKLLTSGARNLPARQQTLRGAIDWSYNLLPPEEQLLFISLAIFVGGCTLEAVEAVCDAAGSRMDDVLDGLESLCNQSLVRREETLDGGVRFVMLEMLYEYARERLQAMSDADSLRWQHASYYIIFTESIEPKLTGPQQNYWFNQLEGEHDNVRAALSWSLEQGHLEITARLSAALWRFWYARGHLSEGRRWLVAVSEMETLPPLLHAKALNGAGILAWTQGDYGAARRFLEQSLILMREAGDTSGVATLLNNLGLVSMDQGNYLEAGQLFEESLVLARHQQHQRGIGLALSNLGTVARLQHDYATAIQCNQESLIIWHSLGDQWSIATVLNNLAYALCAQNDCVGAQPFYEESLSIRHTLTDKEGIAECLEGLAFVASIGRQPSRAVHLCRTAELLREAIGAPLPPAGRAAYEQTLDAVRNMLDETTFSTIWMDAQTMSLEQTIAYALEGSVHELVG